MSLDTFAHETNFRITFDFGLNSSDTINNKYYIIYNEITTFSRIEFFPRSLRFYSL